MLLSSKKVKLIDVYLYLIIISVLASQLLGQETKRPFSISISAPSATFKAGKMCDLTIVSTNISIKELALSKINGMRVGHLDYTVEVILVLTNSKKNLPLKIKARTDENQSGSSSFQFVFLKPGESMSETVALCSVFDLSKSGSYRVKVSRRVPKGYGLGRVISNEVEIKIVP